MKKKLSSLILMSGLLSSPLAWADWHINDAQSNFNFSSVKAAQVGPDAITEVHQFQQLEGSLKKDGTFEFSIPVQSLNTGIEIRDERMLDKLFQHTNHAAIQITGQVDLATLGDLKPGEWQDLELESTLTLLGQSHPIKAHVRYIDLGNQRFMVNTLEPIIVNGNEFGLSEGIVSLQEIAGLAFIAHTVPVNFSLVFVPN